MSAKIRKSNKYIWNSSTCTVENGIHLESIIGYSVITWDEIKELTETILAKNVPIKTVPTKNYLSAI